jgi:hypothetical protein
MAAPSTGLMAVSAIFVKQTGALLAGKILPDVLFDPIAKVG